MIKSFFVNMKLRRITISIFIINCLHINAHGGESETFSCGKRLATETPLIVNGHKSKDGDWPWHATIHADINQNILYRCGGTLLSSDSILTAAHCVYSNSGEQIEPDRIFIHLGRLSLQISSPNTQEMEASNVDVHEHYNATSMANDIAIIRLKTKATFNDYVQPICLWDSSKPNLSEVVGKRGTVIGFGITEENKVAFDLREASIPVVDRETCRKSNPTFYTDKLFDNVFCAGFRNGTTACNGDSGGSLTFEENGVFRIRGIVSFSQTRTNSQLCRLNQYVVFTDVAKYYDWIREKVPSIPSPSA